jgi:hypothetical protein
MLRTLAITAALALSACASTPTYTRAPTQGAAGYSETQIESNRYFVTYRAPSGAAESLLYDYALLRAADITLERGREWFWVDRRNFDSQSQSYNGPRIGIGIGGARWGGNTSIGSSVGISVPLGGRSGVTARAATLEIRLGEGAKPNDANAYDARAIATNIRTRQTP